MGHTEEGRGLEGKVQVMVFRSTPSGRISSHNVAFGGFSQETPEGDDGGHAGAVQEEDGSQTLEAKSITNITP